MSFICKQQQQWQQQQQRQQHHHIILGLPSFRNNKCISVQYTKETKPVLVTSIILK